MAESKEFSRFVKEVLPDSASQGALQTLCAAALFQFIKSKRAIYLYGYEANGKSVFTTAVQQIVRATSVLIHELATTKPLPVRVFTTPLVIVGDDDALPKRQRRLACQNIMDILIQREIKGVYIKYSNPVWFKPTCLLLFISSVPPTWPEGFELFNEWILPVEMPRRFIDGEADPDLKDFYRKSRLGAFDWICAAARKQMETED